MKGLVFYACVLLGLTGLRFQLDAQDYYPEPTPSAQPDQQFASQQPLLSADELDQLLAPIALYPDPLIAQILPASTFPSQVVMAARYLQQGGDPNLIDQQPWDPSVQALARFPTVLQKMDSDLNWTTELGQAFLGQQQDVMDSIQRLRVQAQNLGNLQTSPQQIVTTDNGMVEIAPANPQTIYVPTYDPSVVFYQQFVGVPFITFGPSFVIGPWFNHDFDWHHRDIIVWGPGFQRPPGWWGARPGFRPRPPIRPPIWRPPFRPGRPVFDRGFNRPVRPGPSPGFRPPGGGGGFKPGTPAVKPGGPSRPGGPGFQPGRPPGGGQPGRPSQPGERPSRPPGSTVQPGERPSRPPGAGAQPGGQRPQQPRPPTNRPQRPANGAVVGSGSARNINEASSRGRASRSQMVPQTRPAPTPRTPSAPPAGGGRGGAGPGGGGRGSGAGGGRPH